MKAPVNLKTLPKKPGIYQYKNSDGEIIYIGKAKDIRKRVSTYFAKEHFGKTAHLVRRIAEINFIVTPSEVEALLLEAQQIRKHQPKYNIDLKHNIRYAWIKITNEEFPRLLTARRKDDKGEYFGPFVHGHHRRVLVTELQKRFFIRTCRVLPKKACLRYHIGICKAPCIGAQDKEDYMKNVERVRKVLSGKNDELIKELQAEMKTYSANEEFEQAQTCKQQIETLHYLQEQLLMHRAREHEEDVINYEIERRHDEDIMHLQVFSYRNGLLAEKQDFKIPHDEEAFDEFLKRYYELNAPPKTIIVPHEPSDDKLVEYLSQQTTYTVRFTVPQRGIKKQQLNLVTENIHAQQTDKHRIAREIQELLGTPRPVYTIECFDISHHAGQAMVGSMVHFKDGKPLKSKYRRYKITTVIDTVDDFRAMHEVVLRRYKRTDAFPSPDLVVVDGGRIQVDFAMKALDELGLDIPLVGLAKKEEEIYYPGEAEAERYDKRSDAMKTLIRARDEAHRFAVSYHRLRKSKETLR